MYAGIFGNSSSAANNTRSRLPSRLPPFPMTMHRARLTMASGIHLRTKES